MNTEKKVVIIYLPNGNEKKFTTSKAVSDGSNDYNLVKIINCEPNQVLVGWTQGEVKETEAYVRMPYLLQIWK